MKKAELRSLLQNIDKELAATVTFEEFLGMATPKVIGEVLSDGSAADIWGR